MILQKRHKLFVNRIGLSFFRDKMWNLKMKLEDDTENENKMIQWQRENNQ